MLLRLFDPVDSLLKTVFFCRQPQKAAAGDSAIRQKACAGAGIVDAKVNSQDDLVPDFFFGNDRFLCIQKIQEPFLSPLLKRRRALLHRAAVPGHIINIGSAKTYREPVPCIADIYLDLSGIRLSFFIHVVAVKAGGYISCFRGTRTPAFFGLLPDFQGTLISRHLAYGFHARGPPQIARELIESFVRSVKSMRYMRSPGCRVRHCLQMVHLCF